jgi:hypothetical protein
VAFSTAALPKGVNTLYAVYDGIMHYAASTSRTVAQIVK